MVETSRYRIENSEPTVDIKLASLDRLFDKRDPAPFRERDLDPDLVEYLMDTAEDLMASARFRILFWLETPCPPAEIEAAFRAHFAYEIDRRDRARRRARRAGWISLAIATVSIVGALALGGLVARALGGTLGAGLREVFVISGWVLMWRPVEVLVYDSIPWRRERRVLRRLLAAPVETRIGTGP